MALQTNLNLLDLPVDVLTLILRPLVTTNEAISLCPCAGRPLSPLPVLLSHPALHAIACPILYAENVFELDMTGRHGTHVRRLLEDADTEEKRGHAGELAGNPTRDEAQDGGCRSQLLLVPRALARIHVLRLRLDRLRGWIHSAVVPRLQEMVVRGVLAHLSISVCSTGATAGPSVSITSSAPADAGIFGRPPMAGLLSVLADPYLRTARLWVSHIHGPAWCEFHTGKRCALYASSTVVAAQETRATAATEENSDLASVSQVPTVVTRCKEENEGLLEVNWRKIVQTVDPEGKALAVAWKDDLEARRWL